MKNSGPIGVVRAVPPTSQRREIDWNAYVADVRSFGGEWCSVGEFSPSMATYLRNGRQKAFLPPGMEPGSVEAVEWMFEHWEIVTRTVTATPHRLQIFVRELPCEQV